MAIEIRKDRIEMYYTAKGFSSEFARAASTFFYEETNNFSEHLSGYLEKYPDSDSDKIIDSLRAKIALPIETVVEIFNRHIPVLDLNLREHRKVLSIITSQVEQAGPIAGKKARGFVNEYSKMTKLSEKLLEDAKTRLPEYSDFIKRLLWNIKEKTDERRIVTLEDYDMQDRNVRNEIYKKSLEGKTWLLGYDLKLTSRLSIQLAKENRFRLKSYESLPEDMKDLVKQKNVIGIFPEPLNADEVSGKTVYEKILTSSRENVERYTELGQVIENYFKKRAEEIMKGA